MARPPAGLQRGEAIADLGVAPQYLPQGRGCRHGEDGREIGRRWVSRIERRDDRVAGGRVGGRHNALSTRTACTCATRATAVLRAAALRIEPLADSGARLAISGRSAAMSPSSAAVVTSLAASRRTALA